MENLKKNIIIIGGGPGGMETASCLNTLGYTVFLVEKGPVLGGHLAKWDRLFPEGNEAAPLIEKMRSRMEGVKWFVNTEVLSVNRLGSKYTVILSNGLTINADALLIATGFSLFPAEKKEEYGYGIYDRVITSADLERMFREGMPEGLVPKKIGFVHCVGSRDEKAGNRYCSKVCCATSVKQACEIKAMFPDADVFCFYMDLRMFGRGYEDMYLEAQKDYGVFFVRGRVSEVAEKKDGRLLVKAEDTLAGKPLRITLDLLVLLSGMVRNTSASAITKMLSLSVREDGFFKTSDMIYNDQRSAQDGIFYAGACTGPKTLPETLADARAAALEADFYLRQDD